jgi:hypothetical protein
MRYIFGAFLFLASCSAFSDPYELLVKEIESGKISLSTVSALVTLDNPEYKTGYGLCMAANRSGCVSSGSVGYGICMAANRSGCVSSGSIGYGLCMAANPSGCVPSSSIGYGLCMAANRSGCVSN